MVVTIFFVVSMLIVLLYFLNQLRITAIPIPYFFMWIKWYVLAIIIYYAFSSNHYYITTLSRHAVDGLNLAMITILSFGMIIYARESSLERQREEKLKELMVACALMEEKTKQEKLNK